MIVKARSLVNSAIPVPSENTHIFQVPQTVKLITLAPKKRLRNYSSLVQDSNGKNKNPSSSNARIETSSPLYYTQTSSNKTAKFRMFNNYVQNFSKVRNTSFSPLLKLKIPNQGKEIQASKPKTSKIGNSNNINKPISVKRRRPARFLSQEDLENHIKTNKEKVVKVMGSEQDMKILMENNHVQILKSLEDDKICRLYQTYFKKPGIIKNSEWIWESPESSPKNVKFKDHI